ncbi:hypothetical protein WME95_42645 [Sorangium sp. So ce327]|jgi:hypothetical protein|uniref:hypothetical protein n=1 Tax=Sorangium sp. So ce327 TaxID=3133301 RepID=UPI003F635C8C
MVHRFFSLRAMFLAFLAFAALSMLASAPASAQEPLPCESVGLLGTVFHDDLLERVDAVAAGIRIENLGPADNKTFVIHGAEDVSVTGCELTARLGATLHRRLRRDAHGTVTLLITLKVLPLDGLRFDVRLSNPRVTDVDLSRTTAIGEAIYRAIANGMRERLLPVDRLILSL